MREITHEELQQSTKIIHEMTEGETRKFVMRMQKEQPCIQVYIAALCDRGDFDNENDSDAFANLSMIVFHAMRTAAGGPLAKVKDHTIELYESKMMALYNYAEGEEDANWPSMVQAWMAGCNQRPALEFILQELLSRENPYQVTEAGSGLIFTYLKVIIDCLDNANAKSPF